MKHSKKKSNRANIFLSLSIFFLGIFFILFYYKTPHNKTTLTGENFLPKGKKAEYMGIYLKGYKVGYTASITEPYKDGYRVYSKTYMKMSPMGQKMNEVVSTLKAEADKRYSLKSFYFNFASGKHKLTANGQVKGKILLVDIITEGKKRSMKIPLKYGYIPVTLEGIVESGKTGNFDYFDPSMQSLFEISIKKIGNDILDGVKTTKYAVRLANIDITFWVDKKGNLIKEESPIGLVMKRESEQEAKKLENKGFKLFESYAVGSGKYIQNPREIKMLKVVLKNVDLKGLAIADDRQKLFGDTLIIRTTYPAQKYTIPDSMKKYLVSTPFIPADDPEVKSLANKIVGNSTGWDAVKKIVDYLYLNIKKVPTFSIPNALDVIHTKEGDCNEHATLFVALARSLGIPAKVNVGLVYVGGEFYYHAWASVYLGRWVDVDPTFGQAPADASHLKLEQGNFSNQAKLYKIIGRIKVEVLDYD